MRSYASGDNRTLCQPLLFVYWTLVSAPNCTIENGLWLNSKSKHQKYFYMLMSYYVNVAERQNLTNSWSLMYQSNTMCKLSDKVQMCCASHPGQREGCLCVIFTVFLRVTICVFTFVQITGSQAANSAYTTGWSYLLFVFTYVELHL